MKFDWTNFSEYEYKKYLTTHSNDVVGHIYVGDICIESFDSSNAKHNIWFNLYVAHEDTGYGYTTVGLPYDFAGDTDCINILEDMDYEDFRKIVETFLADYITKYDKTNGYSLIEHANRPLERW